MDPEGLAACMACNSWRGPAGYCTCTSMVLPIDMKYTGSFYSSQPKWLHEHYRDQVSMHLCAAAMVNQFVLSQLPVSFNDVLYC